MRDATYAGSAREEKSPTGQTPSVSRHHLNDQFATESGGIMRIYEGDYAYEIERILDPATHVSTGWRYNVYRIRPRDELLRSGDAATKEEAEEKGKRLLSEVVRAEHHAAGRNKPAA